MSDWQKEKKVLSLNSLQIRLRHELPHTDWLWTLTWIDLISTSSQSFSSFLECQLWILWCRSHSIRAWREETYISDNPPLELSDDNFWWLTTWTSCIGEKLCAYAPVPVLRKCRWFKCDSSHVLSIPYSAVCSKAQISISAPLCINCTDSQEDMILSLKSLQPK